MRGRTADGKWIAPFDPAEPYYNFMMKEASGWSTLWLVPHDVQGLINLLGGRDAFNAKLDAFFSTPYDPKGICRDCTGVIGQYVQGNQPDQQAAYLYAWSGQPWKTQALTRRILAELYGSDASGYGYPGMDDQGSTSSWYVLSAMGFYPVDPSSPDYIIGSPIFDRVRLRMGNGKVFEIVARNNSDAEQVHPVRHAQWQAVEQTLVQPCRHRRRRHAGTHHGFRAEQGVGRGPRRCTAIDVREHAVTHAIAPG